MPYYILIREVGIDSIPVDQEFPVLAFVVDDVAFEVVPVEGVVEEHLARRLEHLHLPCIPTIDRPIFIGV